MSYFVDTVGETVTFGMVPLAHWPSVEGGVGTKVFACKLVCVDFFGCDPVCNLTSVSVKT